MTLADLARIASDGAEGMTNTRWQFNVLMRTGAGKRSETWWHRVVKVLGIRAVVGHTAVGFLEDDRLLVPLTYIEDETPRSLTLNLIILNGLAPGGDGITSAIH